MFQVDAVSSVPIYRQILDQLRRLVASGQLSVGDALPSVRDLAMQHAVNPMTVSKAYNLAEAEGLLTRQRGRPMTVAKQKVRDEPERLGELDAMLAALIEASEQLDLNSETVTRYLIEKWSKEPK